MRLSMKSIAAVFDADHVNMRIFNRTADQIMEFAEYNPDDETPDPHVLYLVPFEKSSWFRYEKSDCNILIYGMSDLDIPDSIASNINIIVTDLPMDRGRLQQMWDQAPPQTGFARQLLSALSLRDPDVICRIVSDYYMNPVLVCNATYEVLSFHSHIDEEACIKEYVNNNLLREDVVQIFDLADQAASSGALSTTHKRYSVNGKTVLFCTTYEVNLPIFHILVFEKHCLLSMAEQEEMEYMRQAFATCHDYQLRVDHHTQLIQEHFLTRLVNNEIPDNNALIYSRFHMLGVVMKSNLFMLVVANNAEDGDKFRRTPKYIQFFKNILTPAIITIYEGRIIALYSTDEDSIPEYTMDALKKLLIHLNMSVGISKRFHEISEASRYYRQSVEALTYGKIVKHKDYVYPWEHYAIYQMLSRQSDSCTPDDFLLDPVKKLIEYDRKNHSDLLLSLYQYLRYVFNTTKAADALHIHRNTLLYRIRKIAELTDIDFEDGETLFLTWLSFQSLRLNHSLDAEYANYLQDGFAEDDE